MRSVPLWAMSRPDKRFVDVCHFVNGEQHTCTAVESDARTISSPGVAADSNRGCGVAVKLESLHSRVLDVDVNEFIPPGRGPEVYGERARRFVESTVPLLGAATGLDEVAPDTAEITPESVWVAKGATTPGATNVQRRPAVLDEMGIRRQLVLRAGHRRRSRKTYRAVRRLAPLLRLTGGPSPSKEEKW